MAATFYVEYLASGGFLVYQGLFSAHGVWKNGLDFLAAGELTE